MSRTEPFVSTVNAARTRPDAARVFVRVPEPRLPKPAVEIVGVAVPEERVTRLPPIYRPRRRSDGISATEMAEFDRQQVTDFNRLAVHLPGVHAGESMMIYNFQKMDSGLSSAFRSP